MTEALVEIVSGNTTITNKIGTSPVRFFPILLPQGLTDYPSAAYRWFSNIDHPDFDGASTHDFGHVDIHNYGKTIKEARDLWRTMRTQLEDTTGTFASTEITGIEYQQSGEEDYLDELELHTKHLELKVTYLR